LLALYDLYHTKKSYKQKWKSEIRSRTEYLIPSGNIVVLA